MPFRGAFGTRLYPRLLRLATGFPATDGPNGFRAFKTGIPRDPKTDTRRSWLDPYGRVREIPAS
jgi:hypothetical protein